MNLWVRDGLRATLMTSVGLVVLLAGLPQPGFAQGRGCSEPNDDPSTACPLANGAAVESFVERPGDIDTYSFVLGTPGSVQVDLTSLPADYDLYAARLDNLVVYGP